MTWILSLIGLVASWYFSRSSSDRFYEGMVYGAGGVFFSYFLKDMIRLLGIKFTDIIAAVIVGYIVFHATGGVKGLKDATVPPTPIVKVDPPRKRIFPLRETGAPNERFVESETGPDGQEVMADIIPEIRKRNINSLGAGCCVFRSAEHTGREQGVHSTYDFAEWMVKNNIKGGGTPPKFDKLMADKCKSEGVDVPPYLQHEEGDPKFLEAALKNGWSVCVTYAGRDPRYQNEDIAHMVNLVYLDDKYAAILDNNFITKPYWMTRKDFLDRWNDFYKKDRYGNTSKGWSIAFLTSPSIPVLKN